MNKVSRCERNIIMIGIKIIVLKPNYYFWNFSGNIFHLTVKEWFFREILMLVSLPDVKNIIIILLL